MYNLDKVKRELNDLIKDRGVKGSHIAKELGISHTFLFQVLKGERNFSVDKLSRAIEFLKEYGR